MESRPLATRKPHKNTYSNSNPTSKTSGYSSLHMKATAKISSDLKDRCSETRQHHLPSNSMQSYLHQVQRPELVSSFDQMDHNSGRHASYNRRVGDSSFNSQPKASSTGKNIFVAPRLMM